MFDDGFQEAMCAEMEAAEEEAANKAAAIEQSQMLASAVAARIAADAAKQKTKTSAVVAPVHARALPRAKGLGLLEGTEAKQVGQTAVAPLTDIAPRADVVPAVQPGQADVVPTVRCCAVLSAEDVADPISQQRQDSESRESRAKAHADREKTAMANAMARTKARKAAQAAGPG